MSEDSPRVSCVVGRSLEGSLCRSWRQGHFTVRQPLLGLKTKALVGVCAAMRPGPLTSPMAATKASLRTLARRWQQLQAELTQLDTQLQTLVTSIAPPCWPCPGSGSRPPGSCW
jgi:hypothetical protein